jgi:hypothetical protein
VSSARSDDTKSLKGPVLDWIVPPGQSLTPPLARNVKWIVGITMSVPVPSFALQEWTGTMLSMLLNSVSDYLLNLIESIKEQLRGGELVIPGDQWPVFLYANSTFDAEDPWKGVFRSSILVSVGHLYLSFD